MRDQTIELRGKLITVDLWHLTGEVAALLFPAPTGITYTNQVGGFACNHPEVEGYLIPVRVEHRILGVIFFSKLGPFRGHCYSGIPAKFAEEINHYLPPGVSLDMERLKEAQEAWLPIVFCGIKGILTWENSD